MDGYKKKKTQVWRGNNYSDTRMSVVRFLEKECPLLSGRVLNVSAGGWPVPKQLLDFNKVKEYITFDQKLYGDVKNVADVYGDVSNMPFNDNEFDALINNQAIECYKNPFKAVSEMHRVLKDGGTLLLDAPFNYTWFGYGSTPESLKKNNPVYDYWRFTPQALEELTKDFSKVEITHSGPNIWDAYNFMVKAVK